MKIDNLLPSVGYKYSYPFLDESADIRVHDNYVEPLYMHIFNIQHPSMAFIGVAYGGVHFRLYDLQVKTLSHFTKKKTFSKNPKNLKIFFINVLKFISNINCSTGSFCVEIYAWKEKTSIEGNNVWIFERNFTQSQSTFFRATATETILFKFSEDCRYWQYTCGHCYMNMMNIPGWHDRWIKQKISMRPIR